METEMPKQMLDLLYSGGMVLVGMALGELAYRLLQHADSLEAFYSIDPLDQDAEKGSDSNRLLLIAVGGLLVGTIGTVLFQFSNVLR